MRIPPRTTRSQREEDPALTQRDPPGAVNDVSGLFRMSGKPRHEFFSSAQHRFVGAERGVDVGVRVAGGATSALGDDPRILLGARLPVHEQPGRLSEECGDGAIRRALLVAVERGNYAVEIGGGVGRHAWPR
jgi:hypothetical protein